MIAKLSTLDLKLIADRQNKFLFSQFYAAIFALYDKVKRIKPRRNRKCFLNSNRSKAEILFD